MKSQQKVKWPELTWLLTQDPFSLWTSLKIKELGRVLGFSGPIHNSLTKVHAMLFLDFFGTANCIDQFRRLVYILLPFPFLLLHAETWCADLFVQIVLLQKALLWTFIAIWLEIQLSHLYSVITSFRYIWMIVQVVSADAWISCVYCHATGDPVISPLFGDDVNSKIVRAVRDRSSMTYSHALQGQGRQIGTF